MINIQLTDEEARQVAMALRHSIRLLEPSDYEPIPIAASDEFRRICDEQFQKKKAELLEKIKYRTAALTTIELARAASKE